MGRQRHAARTDRLRLRQHIVGGVLRVALDDLCRVWATDGGPFGNNNYGQFGFDYGGGRTDYVSFSQLPGDANLDGRVDVNDLTIVLANFGRYGGWAILAFNGDGIVDMNDLTIVLANFGRTSGGALRPCRSRRALFCSPSAQLACSPLLGDGGRRVGRRSSRHQWAAHVFRPHQGRFIANSGILELVAARCPRIVARPTWAELSLRGIAVGNLR